MTYEGVCMGVKGPIVSVWHGGGGGEGGYVCMDVHAADFVIDSAWLVWSLTACKEVAVKNSLSLSLYADHSGHLMLFRIHMSRKAAGKTKAVLEGLGLDITTIRACETAHHLNDEEIVQDGLIRWCGGKGTQPPTWNVLITTMEYAEIAQQDIEELKQKLGH